MQGYGIYQSPKIGLNYLRIMSFIITIYLVYISTLILIIANVYILKMPGSTTIQTLGGFEGSKPTAPHY